MKIQQTKIQQTGFMLLEALFAILIFSMGILALVGMQAAAINNVADAKYRSTAGFLANQIIGSVWATRLNANIASASNVIAGSPVPTFACNPCTATNGNNYTQAWAASGVAANLPSGQAAIALNGAQVTVTVQWTPPTHNASPSVTHRHVTTAFIN
jgi:type IV pilus assembly protein PilV